MKRDMDLIRSILLAVQQRKASVVFSADHVVPDGVDPQIGFEHVKMLVDKGYLEGECSEFMDRLSTPADIHIERMTWEGHDLVDSIADEQVWTKTKAKAAKVGGSVSVDVLKELAVHAAKSVLGLP